MVLLFIYILWRDDFKQFFRTLNCSETDLLSFLLKEISGKSANGLDNDVDVPEDEDFDDDDDSCDEGHDATNNLQTYTRKQVMELLHVSESTLWRYQKKNILTARTVGPNHVVFIKSEVDALINKKKGGVGY